MSVGKVVQLLTRLQGTQGTVTLGRRQIAKGLQKMGASEKDIIQIFSEFQNPKLHVSYKGSEQGFTVATAKLMDGKQVLANGAISTNGTGLDNLKVRMNVGENGKYYTASAWGDLAKELNFGSFKTNASIEDGVWQCTQKIGDNIGGYVKFNAKDSLDDLKHLAVKQDPSAGWDVNEIKKNNKWRYDWADVSDDYNYLELDGIEYGMLVKRGKKNYYIGNVK